MKITRFYQKKIDSNYIQNTLDAQCIFESYLNNDNDYNELQEYLYFRQSLKLQHKAMTNRGYQGNTKSPELNRPIINALRDEPEFHSYLCTPCLKKEWYKDELKKYKLKEIIYPNIEGIPVKAFHQLLNDNNGLFLSLPENHYLKYYLILMSELMLRIKILIKNSNPDDIGRYCILFEDVLIETLGHYIHLFVIGHPFEKVNFSLCMMQVNYILNRTINKSIFHEYLDFKCFMNDTDTIIDEFKNMIRRSRK